LSLPTIVRRLRGANDAPAGEISDCSLNKFLVAKGILATGAACDSNRQLLFRHHAEAASGHRDCSARGPNPGNSC
jgi:hypothetical protein